MMNRDAPHAGRDGLRDELNFAVTNWLPRRTATRFMGWFSRIRNPLVRDLSLAAWQAFSHLDLSDARKSRFDSVHDCFIRELKPGARTIDDDPDVLVSPCDAIVGASGALDGVTALQAKGRLYPIADLLCDRDLAEHYRDGCYVTLRLTATMYHRFHAPADCRVEQVSYLPGDFWNVNGPAARRLDRLYCRNERAVIRARRVRDGALITLVPVAAILVGSLRLRFLDTRLYQGYAGPPHIACDAGFKRGEELGWFEHGSTILLLAPAGYRLLDRIAIGQRIRMGERLLAVPSIAAAPMAPRGTCGPVPVPD